LPVPGVVDGSKECRSTTGSTAAGCSVIGAAAGSTEKAGDLADRDARRLDFFGTATSTGASGSWSVFGSPAGSTAGSTTTGCSVIGSAEGSTEKAGDLAALDERRLDFVGAATCARASWGRSLSCGADDPASLADPASPEACAVSACTFT
jgi:hypothetical protein